MGTSIKEAILLTIYNEFEKWSAPVPRLCAKGCSGCCSQNVSITALEGERILDFIGERGLEQWFADRLQVSPSAPVLTPNEYAAACLQQIEVEEQDPPPVSHCSFLEEDCCTIYPVRPFACRCFLSEIRCQSEKAALQPDYYLAAATAMMQLIEHLGQNEYWGNMADVLLALCDILKFKKIASLLPESSLIIQARLKTRKARPLPGFLLLDEERERISPLLENILSTRIDGRSIEDILNGKVQ
jgi:Fe-S-cluster containining protein